MWNGILQTVNNGICCSQAMQRNDMSEFFCVDSESGEIIPDTKITAGSMPPLTLYICQAYDEVCKYRTSPISIQERFASSRDHKIDRCGVLQVPFHPQLETRIYSNEI